jgi:hypothetical protein
MHSEAWWIRVMDDELTLDEERRWEAHLATCLSCQQDLDALLTVDDVLRLAPAPPPLGPDFTVTTVERISRTQRWRRLLGFIAGAFIVALVSALVLAYVGSTYASLESGLGVVISARQLLFRSLVQTLVGLVLSWKAALPFIVGVTFLTYILVMPNSVLVTLGVLWISRQRRATTASAG